MKIAIVIASLAALLGIAIGVASQVFDTQTTLFLSLGLVLVVFFGSMPVLLGALAGRKRDR
ncbi:MAG: hypothetical protein AB7G11_00540 [Phycisphaerales bacterium]